jgi:sporulation protein YlmC with PRC-barrel domain
MFNKVKTLHGYKLLSLDGEIGSVKDFYFDDRHWTIRYLVADTGNWLTGRQVLISPYALGEAGIAPHHIAINLTKKQIEDSPAMESDVPVSKQYEAAYFGYYGWPTYWSGPFVWGDYPYPVRDRALWNAPTQSKESWNPHLRSIHDVSGHNIQTVDGEIGHVVDFIIDDDTWAIRYLIVDTQNWWPGKRVLISPKWIERVSWRESKVFVNLPRETIKQAPEYKEDALPTRDYEIGLHKHYNRPGYWVDEPAVNEHSHWSEHGEPKEGLTTF